MQFRYTEIIKFIRKTFDQPEGFIPLHAPVFNGNEKKYLNECIDSTYVSSVGKFVDRFEENIACFTGAKKAVVCVNGTNALHLALMLAGVNRDDEVITQPLTFIATANAINYCGAHPVFVDVDRDTLGLSPKALQNWLEENVEIRKTKHVFSSVPLRGRAKRRGSGHITKPPTIAFPPLCRCILMAILAGLMKLQKYVNNTTLSW